MTHDQNENISKEIKNIKESNRNPRAKNTITDLKNFLEGFNGRLDQTEKKNQQT